MADTAKVFVGNLAWSTTDEELNEFMSKAGTVVSAEIQTHEDTGRSKGWGLAEFSTPEEAAKAVSELNGQECQARTVHVRLDRSSIDTTSGYSVFVGNLPWSTDSEGLQEIFAPFEPFDVHVKTNMAGRSRGFAIVRFSTPEQAQSAIADMNGYMLEGRAIQVREDRDLNAEGDDEVPRQRPRRNQRNRNPRTNSSDAPAASAAPAAPRNTVFVGNLSWSTTDDELLEHFQGVEGGGAPVSAEVQVSATGRSKGWGLVTFDSPEDAQAAIDSMNRSDLGGRQINVRMDRK
mmetsp:Transcript_14431/g.18917  ORF Transcript_14431/g.18917 Transcript_14431/m.18917 type:complete len:290 (+) Transcript_14431:237-1106(+)